MKVLIVDAEGTTYEATPVATAAEYLALRRLTGWDVLEAACSMLSRALLADHPDMTAERVAEKFRPDGLIAALAALAASAIEPKRARYAVMPSRGKD